MGSNNTLDLINELKKYLIKYKIWMCIRFNKFIIKFCYNMVLFFWQFNYNYVNWK
jgi:hypothetical protein